jgi:hypothetical protein
MLRGQWKEKEKLPLLLFPLPPQVTYLGFHLFPLISQFYFTMVLGRYLCIPSFFPWPINYNHAFQCHRSPTHSLSTQFGRRFFFSWNYGVAYGHILQVSSYASEWRISSRVIFRFDIDVTSSWWRPRIVRDAHSFWSRSLSSLILLHFPELLHLNDFVAGWPCFWWWT